MKYCVTKHCAALLLAVFMSAGLATAPTATEAEASKKDVAFERPRIDVAFVLDTTGSMSALIEGAKHKIWSIATEMTDARIPPDIRMALIAYRDRGDQYVTQTTDLTGDIDAVYGALLQYQASGGGDRPESVNQALSEAIGDLKWDTDPRVYRVVFLVGDSPPKMNYQDDTPYDVTARSAQQADIIINTVLAGGAQDTGAIWRTIASLANGQYAEIPQSGNMRVIKTPYDQDIQALNTRINGTTLLYGTQTIQTMARKKVDNVGLAAMSVIADRNAYQMNDAFAGGTAAKAKVITGRGELVNDIAVGEVDLEDIKPEELPEELKGLSTEEQKAELDKRLAERRELRSAVDKLVIQRAAYIKEQESADPEADSFDQEVRRMIRTQGTAKGIDFKED